MEEKIILVDENDVDIGSIEKMEAHLKGLLHRAFSIFIFNENGDMMIQKRANHKYHSGGLWTNACCSHPRFGETLETAIHRRLVEEMGFDCNMKEEKTFLYRAELDNNLIEHELDHIYIGYYEGTPIINKEEVEDWRWISIEELKKEIKDFPDTFTYWFKFAINNVLDI